MRLRLLLMAAAAGLVCGCAERQQATPNIAYLDSEQDTPEERVETAMSFFAPALQVRLQDAQYVFIQSFADSAGKRPLGSEFYAAVSLDQAEFDRIKAELKPLTTKPGYVSPIPARDWWPDQQTFEELDFYSAAGTLAFDSGFVALRPGSLDLVVHGTQP